MELVLHCLVLEAKFDTVAEMKMKGDTVFTRPQFRDEKSESASTVFKGSLRFKVKLGLSSVKLFVKRYREIGVVGNDTFEGIHLCCCVKVIVSDIWVERRRIKTDNVLIAAL